MSYVTHRPSILHRKQRPVPSKCHEETLEAQYEREQAILRAKQDKQQETQQRLLRSLHPQAEDKAAAWEALVAANSLLASRDTKRAWEPQQPQELQQRPSTAASVLSSGSKPWHHDLATQQFSPADEEAARRRFAAEVAAENQRLAREREVRRAMEEHARRQPVQEQDSWYRRGDTHNHSKSIVSGDGTPLPTTASSSIRGSPQRLSSAGYPWASTEDVKVVAPSQPPAWQPKMQERQYPWSWQT